MSISLNHPEDNRDDEVLRIGPGSDATSSANPPHDDMRSGDMLSDDELPVDMLPSSELNYPAYIYPPPPLPPLTAAELTGPAATLCCDLPCAACGYNLRTLPVAGRCPECGTAVQAALAGDPLYLYDPETLRRIARGVLLATLGMSPPVLMLLVAVLIGLARPYVASDAVGALLALLALLSVVGLLVFLLGVFMFTALLPGAPAGAANDAARCTAGEERTPDLTPDGTPGMPTARRHWGGRSGMFRELDIKRRREVARASTGVTLGLTIAAPILLCASVQGAVGALGLLTWLGVVWLIALAVTIVNAVGYLECLLQRAPGASPSKIAHRARLLIVAGASGLLGAFAITVLAETSAARHVRVWVVELSMLCLAVGGLPLTIAGWRAWAALRRTVRTAQTLRANLSDGDPASAPANGAKPAPRSPA